MKQDFQKLSIHPNSKHVTINIIYNSQNLQLHPFNKQLTPPIRAASESTSA